MIHVCIVDDDSNAREILNNYLISFANNNSIELDIKTFKNGQIYLDSKLDPDIFFRCRFTIRFKWDKTSKKSKGAGLFLFNSFYY